MKRVSHIFFFVAAALCANLLHAQKDNYDRVVDSLTRKGQKDKLIPYFQKELKAKPNNETVLRWLGYLYIEDKQLQQGEKYYNEAIAVNPKCGRCYMNIGQLYRVDGNNSKAMEYFDKAIAVEPTDGMLYATRGSLKENMGNKFQALFDYNKAIELDPKNENYYIQRGLYNANNGYLSLGISDMSAAIDLAPKNYLPYLQRAEIYYQKNMMLEALDDMGSAMKLDSTRAELYTGRGAIYAVLKEYDKSIADYSKAIQLDPADALPYYNRALDRYAKEDLDGSCNDLYACKSVIEKHRSASVPLQDVQSAINSYCDSAQPSYYYQRGIGLFNQQQYAKAVTMYSRGLQKFPNNAMALSFRGNAYYAMQDYKNALPDYDAAIQNKDNVLADLKSNANYKNAGADSINTYVNGFLAGMQISIAESKFALQQYNEALIEINKGIEIAPDLEDFGKENYYNVRGNIAMALGKFELAKNDFDKCLQLNPYFDVAYVNRALAKLNLENQVNMGTYMIYGGLNGQTFNVSWNISAKAFSKKSDTGLMSALNDCSKAIELNGKPAYAYYLRGQIKRILNIGDYCTDLLKARELGFPVEKELIDSCKK